ncbi:hypothetical protein NXS19_008178 [Fusarium pseudograminearum]|nr:hypothetical protein NXS19_008178 [Fusarium pseudograminearum]
MDIGQANTNQHLHSSIGSSTAHREKLPKDNDTNGRKSWWFLSTAFPMIAGTLGPVASAFSICSLAEPWRQSLVPGADIQSAVDIPDPSWLVVIEAIQLLIGIIANLFLLLHMARRVRFGLALPITIVGWYTSSICRIALSATAARPFKDKGLSNEDVIWSQAFYYGMFAAILYFADATLLALTFWGAYTNRYEKSLPLTRTPDSVRTSRDYISWLGHQLNNRKQDKFIKKMILKGEGYTLDPIYEDSQIPRGRSIEAQGREFERRKTEFQLMRRIQARSSTRRRWVAMAISTFLWLSLWFIGACVFQKAEEAQQSWTYFDAIYFCFVAWTTIGYGDLSPKSNLGRSFYVFWSLLALPTMTILISNASDTVVRTIRDGTILVGKVTVLPDDRGFLMNLKTIINKITFGKVFTWNTNKPDNRGASSKATGQQLPTHQPLFAILDPQNTQPRVDFTSRSQNNVGDLPTQVHLQLLLISEIREILGHLKETQPHHYTFEQWAWYLKLIGEDESDPRTHGSVHQQECDHTVLRKWSWIGSQSPLISTNGESEWILGRLMERLQLSLTGENKGQEIR